MRLQGKCTLRPGCHNTQSHPKSPNYTLPMRPEGAPLGQVVNALSQGVRPCAIAQGASQSALLAGQRIWKKGPAQNYFHKLILSRYIFPNFPAPILPTQISQSWWPCFTSSSMRPEGAPPFGRRRSPVPRGARSRCLSPNGQRGFVGPLVDYPVLHGHLPRATGLQPLKGT